MKVDNNLNLLKVLACFAVVVLHVSFICVGNIASTNISYVLYYTSTFAVPMFFMVNGALILRKDEITYKYISKKILSILKIVVLWNATFVILKFIVRHKYEGIISYTINSLMQRGFFFQFWFFGALMIVYITLPVLKKIIKDKRFVKLFILLFLTTISIDMVNMYRGINGLEIVKNLIPQTFRIWTWYLYFILGHLIYIKKDIINKKISFKTNTILLVGFTIICVIYQIFMSNKISSLYAENYYDNILIIIQITLLFTWGLRVKLNNKIINIINFIAPCMIGIYIFHIAIKNVLRVSSYNNVMINTIFIFIVFLISTIISKFINKIKYLNQTINLK